MEEKKSRIIISLPEFEMMAIKCAMIASKTRLDKWMLEQVRMKIKEYHKEFLDREDVKKLQNITNGT